MNSFKALEANNLLLTSLELVAYSLLSLGLLQHTLHCKQQENMHSNVFT